jgi:hypothetical protein
MFDPVFPCVHALGLFTEVFALGAIRIGFEFSL